MAKFKRTSKTRILKSKQYVLVFGGLHYNIFT
jgi:hypothetical protein